MDQQEGVLKTCDQCGATIYPEHLQKHSAELHGDKLLCPHCLKERKEAEQVAEEPGVAEVPIALVDEDDVDPSKPSEAIHSFGGGVAAATAAAATEREWRRPLLAGARNATRCRSFHCKLTDASFVHLNDQINEWVDAHDDVEIKFAINQIGVVEGKHTDPHLIVTVFY